MTDSERQSWEQTRARGHSRFLLSMGILRWGVPFGLFMTVSLVLLRLLLHRSPPTILELVGRFGFFTLAFGYLTGERRWRQCEKDYEKGGPDGEA